MIAQIILSLSILVGLHEIGHLVAAKWFGMRVEQYSIGFPPKIFGMKFGETEYSIGAIPLGGFVKISGMIDESLDTEKLKEEPQPWEFRAKPAWQRLIVMVGGIVLNVILGILIFIFITYVYGESYVSKEELNKHGIYASSIAEDIGLRSGDRVVKINGKDYDKMGDIAGPEVMLEDNSYYTVDRDGEIIDIPIPADIIEKLTDKNAPAMISVRPFKVGKVAKGSNADKAGVKVNDQFLTINGNDVQYYDQFKEVINRNYGQGIQAKVQRDEQVIDLEIAVGQDSTIGFFSSPIVDVQKVQYTFLESIPVGTKESFNVTILNIKGLGKIFKGDVSTKSIKGPIGIAEIFGGTWNWQRFWLITGMLSMWLAFLNFLPIPALDGGHVAFLSFEIISGHKPSDKFLENAQKVGMILLFALMAFVIGNDLWNIGSRWF